MSGGSQGGLEAIYLPADAVVSGRLRTAAWPYAKLSEMSAAETTPHIPESRTNV